MDDEEEKVDGIMDLWRRLEPLCDSLCNARRRNIPRFNRLTKAITDLDRHVVHAIETLLTEKILKIYSAVECVDADDDTNRLYLMKVLKAIVSRLRKIDSFNTFKIYIRLSIRYLERALCPEHTIDYEEDDLSGQPWFLRELLRLIEDIFDRTDLRVIVSGEFITDSGHLAILIERLNDTISSETDYVESQRDQAIACLRTVIDKFIVNGAIIRPDVACVFLHKVEYTLWVLRKAVDSNDVAKNEEVIDLILTIIMGFFADDRLDNSYISVAGNELQSMENNNGTKRAREDGRLVLADFLKRYREFIKDCLEKINKWCGSQYEEVRDCIARLCCFVLDECKRLEMAQFVLSAAIILIGDTEIAIGEKATEAIEIYLRTNTQTSLYNLTINNLQHLICKFDGLFYRELKVLDWTLTIIIRHLEFLDERVIDLVKDKTSIEHLISHCIDLLRIEITEAVFIEEKLDNYFSHFGLEAKKESECPLQLKFSFNRAFKGEFDIIAKMTEIFQKLTSLDTNHVIINSIIVMAQKEKLHRKELLMLLNLVLEALNPIGATDERTTDFFQQLIRILIDNYWNLPSTGPSFSGLNMTERVELHKNMKPNEILCENNHITCLAIYSIRIIAEILKKNILSVAREISTQLLIKCEDLNMLVSISAMRCLYTVVKNCYLNGQPLIVDHHNTLTDSIQNDVKNIDLAEGEHVSETYQRKAVEVFRRFSSTSYLFGEIKRYLVWSVAWPTLIKLLATEIEISRQQCESKRKYSEYKYSIGYHLILEMMTNIADIIAELKLEEDELKKVVILCLPCLSTKQSLSMQKIALAFYRKSAEINKRLVWFELVRHCEMAGPQELKTNVIRLLLEWKKKIPSPII